MRVIVLTLLVAMASSACSGKSETEKRLDSLLEFCAQQADETECVEVGWLLVEECQGVEPFFTYWGLKQVLGDASLEWQGC